MLLSMAHPLELLMDRTFVRVEYANATIYVLMAALPVIPHNCFRISDTRLILIRRFMRAELSPPFQNYIRTCSHMLFQIFVKNI